MRDQAIKALKAAVRLPKRIFNSYANKIEGNMKAREEIDNQNRRKFEEDHPSKDKPDKIYEDQFKFEDGSVGNIDDYKFHKDGSWEKIPKGKRVPQMRQKYKNDYKKLPYVKGNYDVMNVGRRIVK